MSTASLGKTALFARLAVGPGVTVVTPNLRLAQELGREFDVYQVARGRTVWGAPDIVSFSAFVARAYEDALHAGEATDLPLLLSPPEEQALWEDIVGALQGEDGLLVVPQAAAAARDAWRISHAWSLIEDLRRHSLNDDAEAFARWAQRYERATRDAGQTEGARLPELVAAMFKDAGIAKPALLVRYGFDIETAQQKAFFAALSAAGVQLADCAPNRHESNAVRLPCLDAKDEIRQAARWARERLENAKADGRTTRIGIVVPDLTARRGALHRVLRQTMGTGSEATQPFNISLGLPLTEHALVDAAFLILELAGREIEFEHASRALRSPFIAKAETERAARARLDTALRKRAEPSLTLDRLLTVMRSPALQTLAPELLKRLEALSEFRKQRLFGAHTPVEWGRALGDALTVLGFPGERALDSTEYQTLKKWHAVLAQFAQLERVAARMGYTEAVSRLRRIAADTAFQPESPDVPVQVLGVLESAGCEFDHLWVMGLSAEAWPLAARPNPFLPLALQREAGIPEASAESSLALDRRITQGWQAAAPEVVFSHPVREADRTLDPSPLLASIEEGSLALPAYAPMRDILFESRAVETIADAKAPAVPAGDVRGGSSLIKDQAACPFRSFARHRLGAESLEAPHAGLDALERGSLVHQVLATAWAELKTRQALDAMPASELKALLTSAAETAIARKKRERPTTLGGRFADIEKRRLAKLAADWLETERSREDFSVVATEASRAIEAGGLRLNGRLDRIDETADGRRIVIDYKTGESKLGAWLGERPDEPQLPLYLVTAEPEARAIAFAQVRAGDMKFVAVCADADLLPGAATFPLKRFKRAEQSWSDQVKAWRNELERLATAFAAGDASVDPKPKACDYCDQQPFCRINELALNADDAEDEA